MYIHREREMYIHISIYAYIYIYIYMYTYIHTYSSIGLLAAREFRHYYIAQDSIIYRNLRQEPSAAQELLALL